MPQNIKKWSLIIVANITVIIIMILILNYIVYRYFYPKLEEGPVGKFVVSNKYLKENDKEELSPEYREPVGLNYKKGNIVIFGCSYGYGYKLDTKDTFHYKISERLKRPVYNYAISANPLNLH